MTCGWVGLVGPGSRKIGGKQKLQKKACAYFCIKVVSLLTGLQKIGLPVEAARPLVLPQVFYQEIAPSNYP